MSITTNKIFYFVAALILLVRPFSLMAQTVGSQLPTINIGAALDSKHIAPLSSIASKIEYTMLGEGEIFLEGANKALLFHEDKEFIYVAIHNPVSNTGCYKFTKNGKFVSSFAHKGNRGDEFNYLMDISVADDTKNVAIRDMNKVIVYDINGNFITYIPVWDISRHTTIDHLNSNLNFLNGGKLLFSARDPKNNDGYAVIYNLEGERIVRKKVNGPLFAAKTELAGRIGTQYARQAFSHWNNQVKLITQMEDIIYSLDDQMNMRPAYMLDFGKYRNSLRRDWEEHKVLISVAQFKENFRFIMFRISLGDNNILPDQNGLDSRILTIVYDKSKQATYALKYHKGLGISGFANDLDNGMPFRPTAMLGNKMYQFVDAALFITMASKTNSIRMKEIASKLTEESNPVLIEVTLK